MKYNSLYKIPVMKKKNTNKFSPYL